MKKLPDPTRRTFKQLERPAPKHTEGPWRVTLPGDVPGSEFPTKPAVQRGREGGFTVQGLSKEKEVADAILIAAAPDLFDALAAFLEYSDYASHDIVFSDGAAGHRIEAARKAIQKARGE